MGCISSRHHGIVSNPRVFRVYNMDEQGQALSPGKMQITDYELILRQTNKEPIHWPLRSLRRYGFDAELFSFESGRRCPTGPGIYAFKCQRAEALFNLLQESIQRAGQQEQESRPAHIDSALPVATPGMGMTGPSRPSSLMEVQSNAVSPSHSNANVNHPSHSQHAYINEAIVDNGLVRQSQFPASNHHEYVNTGPEGPGLVTSNITIGLAGGRGDEASVRGEGLNYASLDLPSKSSMEDLQEGAGATYINVAGAGDRRLPNGGGASEFPPSWGGNRANRPNNLETSKEEKKRLTYIQLDLKKSDDNLFDGANFNPPSSPISVESSTGPESPTRKQPEDQYSTIDFSKTIALSAKVQSDEGSRKTRHNSNIDELN